MGLFWVQMGRTGSWRAYFSKFWELKWWEGDSWRCFDSIIFAMILTSFRLFCKVAL